jgi:hypothetical protein
MFGDLAEPTGNGQEEMAARIAPHLSDCDEILVTGAWATDDNSSGCVNSVVDALIAAGLTRVRVSESALREPKINPDEDEPDDSEFF